MNGHIFSFLNSIVLLGSLQGFIIGTLVHVTAKGRAASKLLAWLLIIIAMACLKIYLNNIGLTSTTAGSLLDAIFPFMIIMPVGPLIYLYCKAELTHDFKVGRSDRFHFYPLIIDLFHHAAAVVFLVALLLGWADSYRDNFNNWFDAYNTYSDIPRWVSLTVYLVLSFRLVYGRQREPVVTEELNNRSWLKEFISVFLVFDVIWLAFLIPYVIPATSNILLNWLDWFPLYIPLVMIIYWLGIRGVMLGRKEMSNSLRKSAGAKLNLQKEAVEHIMMNLQKSMEADKLFLDAELSVTKLATHLGISAKTLSAVINQNAGKSFNEFVNHYRVEEFKQRLLKADNKKYTLTALAFECGFNSQPTFQRAFKNIVGITPSEYLQRNAVSA